MLVAQYSEARSRTGVVTSVVSGSGETRSHLEADMRMAA